MKQVEAGFNISGGDVIHKAVAPATNNESDNSDGQEGVDEDDDEEYNDDSYEE